MRAWLRLSCSAACDSSSRSRVSQAGVYALFCWPARSYTKMLKMQKKHEKLRKEHESFKRHAATELQDVERDKHELERTHAAAQSRWELQLADAKAATESALAGSGRLLRPLLGGVSAARRCAMT